MCLIYHSAFSVSRVSLRPMYVPSPEHFLLSTATKLKISLRSAAVRESKSANLMESLSSNLRRDRVRYIFTFHYRDHDQSCPFPDSTMATPSGSHVLLDLLVFYTGRLPPFSCCHMVYKYTHPPGWPHFLCVTVTGRAGIWFRCTNPYPKITIQGARFGSST